MYIMLNVILLSVVLMILLAVFLAVWESRIEKQQFENSEFGKKLSRGEYRPTSDSSLLKYVSLDEKNHTFTFGHASKIYNYSQLVSFELVEDGKTVYKSSGRIGRAITGGFIAGGVGAIVGATTANQKSDEKITRLEITAVINPGAVLNRISLISSETSKNGFVYTSNYQLAQRVIALLKSIDQYNSRNTNSEADELMKYKTLLDSGAITQDEYNAKKKQLLGL